MVPAVLQSAALAPHDGAAVTGVLTGSQGEPIAAAEVRLSASAGVYFSTAAGTPGDPLTPGPADDLRPQVTVRSTATGELPPVYAYFTHAGLARILVSAGGSSATALVVTGHASDAYQVSLSGASGPPGSRLVVMGAVLDAFGNPVPNVLDISLSADDPDLGLLGSDTLATDSSGMFSTSFTGTAGLSGSTELVAGLPLAEPGPDPAWLELAGLRIRPRDQGGPTGVAGRATVKLSGRPEFTASPLLIGGGKARLRGTAPPGSPVTIFALRDGALQSTKIGTVVANAKGNWGLGTTIHSTTSFRVRTTMRRSDLLTTKVRTRVTVTARPLGHGRVRFSMRGEPNVPGWVNIYDAALDRVTQVPTDRHGDANTVLASAPGRTRFAFYFIAPGTTPSGRSLTGTVR